MIEYGLALITGKAVHVTSAYHLRKVVNEINGEEILTSNFYYDIIEGANYLMSDEYVLRNFEARYPDAHKAVVEQLKEKGAVKNKVTHFLTYNGVLNILYVYGIDHKTLLKGGEKIPLKQGQLFSQPKPAKEKKASFLDSIFESGSGLATAPTESKLKKEYKPRNYRVYIREFQKLDEKVVLGLNYEISRDISKRFAIVKESLAKNDRKLRTQVYVTKQGSVTQVIIRFVDESQPNSILVSNTRKEGIVENVAIRKSSRSTSVMEKLLEFNLQGKATRSVTISYEHQAIIATFGEE